MLHQIVSHPNPVFMTLQTQSLDTQCILQFTNPLLYLLPLLLPHRRPLQCGSRHYVSPFVILRLTVDQVSEIMCTEDAPRSISPAVEDSVTSIRSSASHK